MAKITPRERTAILNSLARGVVPSIGLEHIQVGRKDEVEAVLGDLKAVEDGAATVRFIVGPVGSGKTFFLHLMRTVALRRRFVVLQAGLDDQGLRLHSREGHARALYSTLMGNLATGSRPQGGALSNVIESWMGALDHSIRGKGGNDGEVIRSFTQHLKPLQELVSGYDFVTVLTKYYEGYRTENEQLQACALRWLRAEYSTKTEARKDLGVRTIIDDNSVYDYLKLFAAFVRLADFVGLLVNIDELTQISFLTNGPSRQNNYEEIHRILNDCLQGNTQGLSFLFAGTDECLQNTRRGLYSHERLASRLAPKRFATGGRRDLSSPVIRLDRLTSEDCAILLSNIRKVFAVGDPKKYLVPDRAITAYLSHCQARLGADCFQTPRDIVKDFVGLLHMLEQNPDEEWQKLLESSDGKGHERKEPAASGGLRKTGLSEFRL